MFIELTADEHKSLACLFNRFELHGLAACFAYQKQIRVQDESKSFPTSFRRAPVQLLRSILGMFETVKDLRRSPYLRIWKSYPGFLPGLLGFDLPL